MTTKRAKAKRKPTYRRHTDTVVVLLFRWKCGELTKAMFDSRDAAWRWARTVGVPVLDIQDVTFRYTEPVK